MLEQLLKIRRQRENDAKARLITAQAELHRETLAYQSKDRELNEFGAWCKEEKTRLYRTVHQQKLTSRKLGEYQQQLARLRSRELRLEDDLANAKLAVDKAQRKLEERRGRHVDTHRDLLKLEAYRDQVAELDQRKAECREENEMDDIIAACL